MLDDHLHHHLQALNNAGKVNENADDYMLFEESLLCTAPSPIGDVAGDSAGFEPPSHKILPHSEPIMDAVACWNGLARQFYLRKRSQVSAGMSSNVKLFVVLSL